MSNRTFLSTQSDAVPSSTPTLVGLGEAVEGTLLPPSEARVAPTIHPGRSTVLPRVEAGPPARLVLHSQERYESVRLLGEGGMGAVELVNDHDIGRQVARKRLHPELRGPGGVGQDKDGTY